MKPIWWVLIGAAGMFLFLTILGKGIMAGYQAGQSENNTTSTNA